MGKIVYGYQSPLSEPGENYASDINRLLEDAGVDPAKLYQNFLEYPDAEKVNFFDEGQPGELHGVHRNDFFLFWNLVRLEQNGSSNEVKQIVYDIMQGLGDYYNWGYQPPPSEMAQELRRGVKNDFTQVMRDLIRHLMPAHPVAQNLALTLIQPDQFERYQSIIYKGAIPLKAVTEMCEDGRILCLRDTNGKEKTYRLRSIETLVGKVKKELEKSK